MTKSTSLNLTLHHNGETMIADILHPATSTVVRCTSITDLVRVIHEHGDGLRPVPAGNWEKLLSSTRGTDALRKSA